MGRGQLIVTNLLTAVLTAAVTSAFWIAAYGNADEAPAPSRAQASSKTAQAPLEPVCAAGGLIVPVLGVSAAKLFDTYTGA